MAFHASLDGLISLDEPRCEDPARTGRKAATLSRLRRAGFRVPAGVVVPVEMLGGDGSELPAAVCAALAVVPERIGPGPWAVRSSSTAEDADQASFAGQFETVLDVDAAMLPDAVLRCWRSRLADRVVAYAHDDVPAGMAVLIQPMIPADAAGVAFTADPVSGERRVVIEAVTGLGDGLVSGRATPERWAVNEDGSVTAPVDAAALDVSMARAIGDLAHQVEQHEDGAQDIEWAVDAPTLWLLQARPITTLSATRPQLVPIPMIVPPGVWTRDAFHEPEPLSPFGRVLLTDQILKVLPAVFAEFGILLDRGEVASIGGWIYNRLVPLGAPPPDGRPPGRIRPPRWLLRLLMRLHPAIRRRTAAARDAVAGDLPRTVIRRWDDTWRPEHQADVARALALDLGSLSDEALADELAHRLAMVAHPAHARVAIAYFIVVYELALVCRDLLGWDSTRMLTLLEGMSTISTEPTRQIARLAELARSRPAVRVVLAEIDAGSVGRLAEVDPEFADAFRAFVEATGHRALRYDVIEPTLAEQPHVLLRLIADRLDDERSPDEIETQAEHRRRAATHEARAQLALRGPQELDRFERALAGARDAYPAWEDRVWWTQSVQTALLRYLALEIGRRLVDRHQLAAVDDVFFLDVDEARSALVDGAERRDTVRFRRGQRAWASANRGPLAYGRAPDDPPPFDLLPPAARLVNEAVLWGFGHFVGDPAAAMDGEVLMGTPASPGRYSGTVRVVRGESEFGKIRRGDVVVCPSTSPAWSIVFGSIGALVADSGGILSHPAIIAREHGIPAVVGAGNATERLEDGQRVTVDGTTGRIELGA